MLLKMKVLDQPLMDSQECSFTLNFLFVDDNHDSLATEISAVKRLTDQTVMEAESQPVQLVLRPAAEQGYYHNTGLTS